MQRTPMFALLLVIATVPVAALPPDVPDPTSQGGEALYWSVFQIPIDQRLRAIVDASGVDLGPEGEQAFEALATILGGAEASLLAALPSHVEPQTGKPKWITVGAEACNGAGSCGGSYSTHDGDYSAYYSFNNNNTHNNNQAACTSNTVFTNLVLLSDGADFCRNTIDYGADVHWYNNTACAVDNGGGCDFAGVPGFIIDFRCTYDPTNKKDLCVDVGANNQ